VRSDPTEQTKTSDEPKAAEDPAPTASVSVSSVPKTADVIVETPKQQPQARVEAATTAISSMVSTVLNPFAGNSPTAPAESPLPWMVMAAARQELGRTPSLNKAVSPVRTSDDVDPVSNALAATDTAPRVIAIPQTSLLQPLQQLPVVGPLFVTPVVALIHQIPFVGDILHPIIGYPLGLTGGTTPRDVKVISFDGTPIYVHFFPAQGVAKGTPAPTS
jgi:ABC-2 type transport system ATP-binding protein